MIDFVKDLNPQQLDVVLHANGPCLVLAGAGSGKTRTITYRVAYLLEQGVNPENILLVTFTNKAANEMVERVNKLILGSSVGAGFKPAPTRILPFAGTFHSIANKILRRYASFVGYQNNFTILDSDDSQSLIKLSLKDYKPNESSYKRFPSANVLQSIISYARNAEMSVDEILSRRYPNWLEYGEQINNIAKAYDQKKKEANSMDFDDLLVNLLLLLNSPLEGGRGVLAKFANQFQYILVDEYQDTNKVQASIIRQLASKHNNVLVVGDDAQSIYSFRAADINNILQFEKEYPNAKIFKLETNYRSSQEILNVANNIIANNVRQYKKKLKTIATGGVKPTLQPQMDQQAEARFIAQKITEALGKGTPASEIAVLFRAAFYSQMLEMELVKAGINYDYRGGLRFFERAHIKDVLAYLRILNNLADTAAWMRVLLHEDGIGPVAAQGVVKNVKSVENVEDVKNVGYQILGDRAKQGWHNFAQIWEAMLDIGKKPIELIKAILQSNYHGYLEAEYIDSKERLADIEQLALFARQYENLEEFLAEASLQESFGRNGLAQNSKSPLEGGRGVLVQNNEKIVLSTIHQAKGLEWSNVFIINLASGAFPNERSVREDNGLEEERRLFYVAVTRAKKHLYLTYPMAEGLWGGSLGGPSMFLEEISSRLLDDHSLLSRTSLVLDNEEDNLRYINEEDDKPFNIKPGSFLREIDDL